MFQISDSRHNRISVPDMPIANTKSATDIKGKLKRKLVAESVPKKGPLKAVIPVNNMQKSMSSQTKTVFLKFLVSFIFLTLQLQF